MIQLRSRSEYSFRHSVGKLSELPQHSKGAMALTDRASCFGHFKWKEACGDIKPIYGVELAVVPDVSLEGKQATCYTTFLAMNDRGLQDIYSLVELATANFYYEPRLDLQGIESCNRGHEDFITLFGENSDRVIDFHEAESSIYCGQLWSPNALFKDLQGAEEAKMVLLACSDPFYPTPEDKSIYEGVLGSYRDSRRAIRHYVGEDEWRYHANKLPIRQRYSLESARDLSELCNASLRKSPMIKSDDERPLAKIVLESARARGIDLTEDIYYERFQREIDIIEEKEFGDYFKIVADLVSYAKSKMIVGPARGSSCGSLVCYLLGITEIDPIPYGLLFERFVDINRMDWPDIDIDFPEDKRHLVLEYLEQRYGRDHVAKLGTVSFFKPNSSIIDVSKAMKIGPWEVDPLKKSVVTIIGRDEGVLKEAFKTPVGIGTLEKFPEMEVASLIEGRVRHSGVHPAGVIVTNSPITKFGAFDSRDGIVQMDKHDAEDMNLLKIDCLGLRVLTVLQSCIDQVSLTMEDLLKLSREDEGAFSVINESRFAGVFQFEGSSLKGLCGKMVLDSFEDFVAITSLSRPGPLASGGADKYVNRKMGREKVEHIHPLMEEFTGETYGVLVYQEQVLKIVRGIANFSWDDASKLRKGLSKSKGVEFMDEFQDQFISQSKEKGVSEDQAQEIWNEINTFGSYGFNRSHAVAYGLISYWCCYLKKYYPLEFAAACLQSAKDDQQTIDILREIHREGIKHTPYCPDKSLTNWSVQEGALIGGLTGIKGIGEKMATEILRRRKENIPLTKGQIKKLETGVTPWDDLFPTKKLWGHLFDDPESYSIRTKLSQISDITEDSEGIFLVIVQLAETKIRDSNEPHLVERRGKRVSGQTTFLMLDVNDDTGSMSILINRTKYKDFGKQIADFSKKGDWFLILGKSNKGFKSIQADRLKFLTNNSQYERKKETTGATV